MAEELGLDQSLRQRRAVEHHERTVLPQRQALNRLRHQLLTSAALAANEHRRPTGRHLVDLLVDAPHFGAVADETSRRVGDHVAQTLVLLH